MDVARQAFPRWLNSLIRCSKCRNTATFLACVTRWMRLSVAEQDVMATMTVCCTWVLHVDVNKQHVLKVVLDLENIAPGSSWESSVSSKFISRGWHTHLCCT